jgi:hypothetical protein
MWQDEKTAWELRNAAQQKGKCRGYIQAESRNLQKREARFRDASGKRLGLR